MTSIQDELDLLVNDLGVTEDASSEELRRLYRVGAMAECADAIGRHMGLPIKIAVTYTAENRRFSSHHLVKTDASGRGIGGIAAQISIPSDLPFYGSSAFKGFRVEILLSKNFRSASPDTAIAVIAHEL